MSIGTVVWGARRQGRLSALDQGRMAVQGIVALWRARGGGAWGESPAAGVDAAVPEGALPRQAEKLLAETTGDWLAHHCHRSYAWACALAARDGLRLDRELLDRAALLHDLGLTTRFAPQPGGCFALSGAAAAEDAMREAGMPPERARVMADAIALDLNLMVAVGRHGAEAALLRAATALDVAGLDVRKVDRAFRDETLARFPRLDFKARLDEALSAAVKQSPRTRIAFLCRMGGLPARLRDAPFDT